MISPHLLVRKGVQEAGSGLCRGQQLGWGLRPQSTEPLEFLPRDGPLSGGAPWTQRALREGSGVAHSLHVLPSGDMCGTHLWLLPASHARRLVGLGCVSASWSCVFHARRRLSLHGQPLSLPLGLSGCSGHSVPRRVPLTQVHILTLAISHILLTVWLSVATVTASRPACPFCTPQCAHGQHEAGTSLRAPSRSPHGLALASPARHGSCDT